VLYSAGHFLLEEERMTKFRGKRIAHDYMQINCAPPEKVFPLLCPVREADWVPGWRYRTIYSQSGLAELGCVFCTLDEDGSETTWIVTEYDPVVGRIGFVWVRAGLMTAQIRISLERTGENTKAHIRYTYTGLSPAGDQQIERYNESWFQAKMHGWEAAINHYLQTGRIIDAAASE
jgi:hypothetical protein